MWLTVENGGGGDVSKRLDPGAVVIGRDETCDVVLDDERASRHHARITVGPDGLVEIDDLRSTNGTTVHGVRISGPTRLHEGDEVRIGRHVLHVVAVPVPPAPATIMAGGASTPPPTAAVPPPAAGQAGGGPGLAAAGPAAGRDGGFGARPVGFAPAAPPMAPPGALVMVPAARGAMPARRHLGVIFAATTAIVAVSLAAVLIVVERRGGTASRPSHAAAAVSADPTLTPAQLASAWGSSTLYVQTDIAGQTQASGSAWVYDAGQGLIVTNAHVVNTGTDFTAGQGAQRQPAEVVGVSVCNDLAVLKVSDTAGLRTFRLGRQASVAQGQSVTVLGYPGNAAETPQLSETTGVVSVAHTAFTDEEGPEVPRMTDMVQISAPINPGNSGGPLLDAHGRLIGVVAASGSGTQDEGYAIGVDRVRSVVSQLARGDSFGYAGMKLVYPTQASDFTDLGLPVVDGGIIVQAADPNSPAYDAISSQIGDRPFVIEDINGQPLDGTLDSYCNAVGGLQAGQTAVFTVVLADGYRANVRLPFE